MSHSSCCSLVLHPPLWLYLCLESCLPSMCPRSRAYRVIVCKPKFGVFFFLRYSSLHSNHLSCVRDPFTTLMISTEEGHICAPSFWSRFWAFFTTFFTTLESWQHLGGVRGRLLQASCMHGRMAKNTTTLPWWWLRRDLF